MDYRFIPMILISCHDTLAISPGQDFCASRPLGTSLLWQGLDSLAYSLLDHHSDLLIHRIGTP
ncbi:MAG TPA: hypothetical protein PLM60_08375 [Methanoregulaceae archaeon]|jgi:hypothetical protein|nr:hypothetical protein [Burkholderiaceae bacterium]NLH25581.1 hypothetical protein [Methanomicrobiales archaeon]HNI42875.1 hypothetical protein [Methanoregulaceae archaeon]HNJ80469.1 hypothetical protein [Methanoregulaceae archaeon]HNL86320.1 hypothetical protein [Methanoregulaceae archaeon]